MIIYKDMSANNLLAHLLKLSLLLNHNDIRELIIYIYSADHTIVSRSDFTYMREIWKYSTICHMLRFILTHHFLQLVRVLL